MAYCAEPAGRQGRRQLDSCCCTCLPQNMQLLLAMPTVHTTCARSRNRPLHCACWAEAACHSGLQHWPARKQEPASAAAACYTAWGSSCRCPCPQFYRPKQCRFHLRRALSPAPATAHVTRLPYLEQQTPGGTMQQRQQTRRAWALRQQPWQDSATATALQHYLPGQSATT